MFPALTIIAFFDRYNFMQSIYVKAYLYFGNMDVLYFVDVETASDKGDIRGIDVWC